MRASQDLGAPRAFVLGGNANTLAFVTSLRSDAESVTAHLVPLAQTPAGTVAGNTYQNVTVALPNLLEWIDSTFAFDDERAFVAPGRDVELLARINWEVEPPAHLDDTAVLNLEDLPEEIAEALAHAPEPLVQCAACRRLCVRDHFIWKERQLCAWDYHKQVFGKRGPWHSGPYEDRHFETLPVVGYVALTLLDEVGVDVVLVIGGVAEEVARETVNVILRAEPERAYLAVKTADGYTLLREK